MNLPTSLIVVLLVVAWLVVLVPMVARRRERIPQVQPAGSGFRVLRRASASLRRRPGRGAKGRTMTNIERQGDGSPMAEEEVLVPVGATEPEDAAQEWAAAQAARQARLASRPNEPVRDVNEQDSDGWAVQGDFSADAREYGPADDESGDLGTYGALTEGDEPPIRLAPPDVAAEDRVEHARTTIADEIDEQEWADHVAAAPAGSFVDVEDVQLRPVPRRPGRGGYDPEAAEATRAYKYQQRRRVSLILLVATVAFTIASLLIVSWLWAGAIVSFTLLVGYLVYLRRQVRIEAAIRQRRMERLQRARQIRPEHGRAPRRARTGGSAVIPGRTLVDLDDDDPQFDDLDEYQPPMTYRRAAGQ